MKNEFIFLLVIGLFLSSCQENNTAKLDSGQPQSSAFKNELAKALASLLRFSLESEITSIIPL